MTTLEEWDSVLESILSMGKYAKDEDICKQLLILLIPSFALKVNLEDDLDVTENSEEIQQAKDKFQNWFQLYQNGILNHLVEEHFGETQINLFLNEICNQHKEKRNRILDILCSCLKDDPDTLEKWLTNHHLCGAGISHIKRKQWLLTNGFSEALSVPRVTDEIFQKWFEAYDAFSKESPYIFTQFFVSIISVHNRSWYTDTMMCVCALARIHITRIFLRICSEYKRSSEFHFFKYNKALPSYTPYYIEKTKNEELEGEEHEINSDGEESNEIYTAGVVLGEENREEVESDWEESEEVDRESGEESEEVDRESEEVDSESEEVDSESSVEENEDIDENNFINTNIFIETRNWEWKPQHSLLFEPNSILWHEMAIELVAINLVPFWRKLQISASFLKYFPYYNTLIKICSSKEIEIWYNNQFSQPFLHINVLHKYTPQTFIESYLLWCTTNISSFSLTESITALIQVYSIASHPSCRSLLQSLENQATMLIFSIGLHFIEKYEPTTLPYANSICYNVINIITSQFKAWANKQNPLEYSESVTHSFCCFLKAGIFNSDHRNHIILSLKINTTSGFIATRFLLRYVLKDLSTKEPPTTIQLLIYSSVMEIIIFTTILNTQYTTRVFILDCARCIGLLTKYDYKEMLLLSEFCDRYPSSIVRALSELSEKDSYFIIYTWEKNNINNVNIIKEGLEAEQNINALELSTTCLDGLLYTCMQDPVMLPSSKQIVDRLTIEQHLEFNTYDPFTRESLELKNIIPMPDLKKCIQKEIIIACFVKTSITTAIYNVRFCK